MYLILSSSYKQMLGQWRKIIWQSETRNQILFVQKLTISGIQSYTSEKSELFEEKANNSFVRLK